jgi:hypothetical protein
MTVLKKVDPKELATRKQVAEYQFRNRVAGYDAYAFTDPATQRPIGAILQGGIEGVLCNSAHDIIPNYIAKTASGYTLNNELSTIPAGPVAFTVYMNRPEADIKRDLVEVLKKVAADYENEIAAYNDAILQKEIESQVQREVRLEQKQQADAEQARRDRITQEVRDALGAKQ